LRSGRKIGAARAVAGEESGRRARHRQRLARGRRQSPRVHQAVHL